MAQHEPVDPLLEFDSLLKQELAVSPSPEFLPRVRERIRNEPRPPRWTSLWLVAPLTATAATLVLAVGLAYWTANDTSPAAPPPPAVSVASAATHANVASSNAPSPEYPPSRLALRRASRVPSTEPRVPNTEYRTPPAEVIVDQRQRAALLSMIRMINDGHLTGESFKDTRQPPVEIGVEPLAVSPIVVGGVLPSEGERK